MKDLGYFKGEKIIGTDVMESLTSMRKKENAPATLILLAPIVPHKLHIAQSVAGVHQKKNTNII